MDQLGDLEDDENLDKVEDKQARIVSEWRKKWIVQVFPDLVPRSKWKQEVRNLQVGDIGLLKYEQKLGPDSWRLARISRADSDDDGRVRTVRVEFRPRHVRDRLKPYKTKTPLFMDIGVQRFAVMLPQEEQGAQEAELSEGENGSPTEGIKANTQIPEASEMTLN